MKNSVWYSKLWQKKMEDLPLPGGPDAGWADMQFLLNKDPLLSNSTAKAPVAKTIVSKVVTFFSYIVPAAAMISAVTYLAVKQPKKPQHSSKKAIDKSMGQAVSSIDQPKQIDSANSSLLLQQQADSVPSIKTDNSTIKPALSAASLGSAQAFNIVSRPFPEKTPEKPKPLSEITRLNESEQHPENKQNGEAGMPVRVVDRNNGPSVLAVIVPPAFKGGALTLSNTIQQKKVKKKKSADKKIKTQKLKTEKSHRMGNLFTASALNFGLNTGLSFYSTGKNAFFGLSATYAVTNRILINAGITLNTNRKVNGQYSHPSYSKDSTAKPFTIVDHRKFNTIDVPISIEYRISNVISIKAGPVFSFPSKQTGEGSKLDQSSNPRDTVSHSKQINSALDNSNMNKVHFGFSGGVIFRIKQFNIEATYLQNAKPYQGSSDLGSYEYKLKSFQIGVGYRFK